MSGFLVSRCICHNRSFVEIKEHAEQYNLTKMEQLQENNYCSCGCGFCIPYIEMMFETGQTEFKPGAFYKKKNED